MTVDVYSGLIVWKACWSFLGGICAVLFWYSVYKEVAY